MAPLTVDPAALDGAGTSVVAVGEGLGSVMSTLTGALAATAGMAGDDPAGGAFGRAYGSSAAKLLEAMAATRNGLCRLGDGVRMSAHNYSVAEAMSNVSGAGDALPAPTPTGPVPAGSVPSAVGTTTPAPPGWGWVAKYIGMIWPTGDSARLRAAAAAWTSAGAHFGATEILGTAGPMGIVRAQQMPEGAAVDAAFTDAYRNTAAVAQQCQAIAAQLTGYADRIDRVHAAILDLLARICNPLTGLKEVWDVLTRKDEDEIKKIADDIRTVVDNFTTEVDALRHRIAGVLHEAETVVSAMGGYAAREWEQFLHGTEAGRAVNQVGQFGKGAGEELGGLFKDFWTYSTPRALIDPQGSSESWKEMLDGMAPLVGLGGAGAPGVGQAWKDLGKGVTHWDEWSTNPAEAAGKSAFDVATLFVPGGAAKALGKGGTAAADAARAAKAAEAAGAAGRSGEVAAHVPRVELPPAERPGAAPVTPHGEPASAPPANPLPHSPTEAKAAPVEKPAVSEGLTTPAPAPAPAPAHPGNPTGPPDPAGVGHHPAAPAPHAPPTAAHSPQSAPTPPSSASHGPIGDVSAAGGHPAELAASHEPGGDHRPPMPIESPAEAVADAGPPAFTLDNPLDQLSPELRALSEQHLTGSGETVLGPFRPESGGPSYIDVAQQSGASYFDIGDAWNTATPTERLAANQHVLDIAIANRDTITLSVPFGKIAPDTFTAAEIRYLEAHGYQRAGRNVLIPPIRGVTR